MTFIVRSGRVSVKSGATMSICSGMVLVLHLIELCTSIGFQVSRDYKLLGQIFGKHSFECHFMAIVICLKLLNTQTCLRRFSIIAKEINCNGSSVVCFLQFFIFRLSNERLKDFVMNPSKSAQGAQRQ